MEEIRSEYVEKLMKINKQKDIKVGSIDNFKKRYNLI